MSPHSQTIPSRSLRPWLIGALVLLGLAVLISATHLYWMTLTGVLEPIDEMLYADMARIAADGGVPFRDIWDIKPPINTYILAAFVRVLGNTVLTVRIAVLVQAAVFVTLITALAATSSRSRLAGVFAFFMSLSLAATASFFEGWQPVMLMTLFTTGAALLVVRGRGGMVASFWAGLLLAVAFYTKAVAAPEGIAIVVLAAVVAPPGRRWNAAIMVVVGGLLGLGVFVLWWWQQGVLLSVWQNAFENSFLYAFETGTENTGGVWHFDDDFFLFFQQYFVGQTLPFLAPLLVLVPPAVIALARSREQRALLGAVLLWLLMQIVGAMIGQSMRRTYFLQVMPSLLLLNALAVPYYLRWRGWVQAVLVGLLTAGLWYGQVITDLPNRVQTLATASWRSPDEAEWVTRADSTVAALQAAVPPGECFWAWDSVGLVRYRAARQACTPEHAAHLMMVRESFDFRRIRAEYLAGLFAARPQVHTRYEVWGYFPELQRFADRYLGETLFEGYHEYGTVDIFAVDMSPFHDHHANFADQFTLIGYDLYTPTTVCAGDAVRVSMTYRLETPPDRYYNTFVQLLTPDQSAQIAGIDAQPHSDRPTIEWNVPGMLYLGDTFTLTVPVDTAPGTYPLVNGFYDIDSADQLPVYGADKQPLPGGYVHLTDITVAACTAVQ